MKIAKSQTTRELIETVAAAKKARAGALPAPEGQTKTVSTMRFKLHEDQRQMMEAALEKAKADIGTTYDTVALEHICIDYMGAPTKQIDPVALMQKLGLKPTVEAINAAFPDVNISIEVGD